MENGRTECRNSAVHPHMRVSPFRTTLTILAVLVASQFLSAQVTRHYKIVALQGDPAKIAGADATIGIVGVDPPDRSQWRGRLRRIHL